ncbi:DNA-binding response regulator [Clostridium zeae]|uniref:Stage 0 sporulation protein A homolog n=1 Tax=Clostridium zeae TaxID=2759022 RepID=A0ABQ1EI31_9CLOT|nr:response regulator transcription factor [Clostridium zeae]GFZ34359.1 DNA-binding response regulator [Clostridium zeae]
MYKVMLVDDEKLIVDGVECIINWEELGLEVAGKASSGTEALEMFNKKNVEVIITDITMPNMDGLKLIEEIKKVNSKTKFIMLSGYDDFQYAKKAISIGVENYILKPINEEELEASLKMTVEKIKREKESPRLKNQEIETIKENIYNRWVTNKISGYELEERGFILELNLKYENYCAALIKLRNNKKRNCTMLLNIIKKRMKFDNIDFFKDFEDNIAIISGWNDSESSQEDFEKILVRIREYIKNELNEDVFITVGEVERFSWNAYKSYERAKKLQSYLLIYGFNKIINGASLLQRYNNPEHISKVNLEDFSKVLMKKDRNNLETYITEIFKSIEGNETAAPALVQDVAVTMMIIISRTMKELNIGHEYDYNSISRMVLSVCNMETLDEVDECIKEESLKALDIIEANSFKFSPVIQQIIDYIKHNFAKELSLKMLADQFNINTSYLGQLFSKEVGISFSDYLNKIRNEKAKELLLNTNMKINEIAETIGYLDTSYFYKKFKKYYGVCPNTLRSSKNYFIS